MLIIRAERWIVHYRKDFIDEERAEFLAEGSRLGTRRHCLSRRVTILFPCRTSPFKTM